MECKITGDNLSYLKLFLREANELYMVGSTAGLTVEILAGGQPFVKWWYEKANELTGEMEIWEAHRSIYIRSDTFISNWYKGWEEKYDN